ncbi:MAG: hypothetical protein GTO02_22330 [Candidatus Dadabacteria bacterium]|nr:hypothetical protein [Candidatus Dadabacteria bacterium]
MYGYKTKQFKGKKFKMFHGLWEGSWQDKRKPLYLILSGEADDLFNSMYVWKLSAGNVPDRDRDMGVGDFVEEINCVGVWK